MTLERAINLLTQDDEDTLITAASYIQNQCFKSADAKKMVCLIIYTVWDHLTMIQKKKICWQLNM